MNIREELMKLGEVWKDSLSGEEYLDIVPVNHLVNTVERLILQGTKKHLEGINNNCHTPLQDICNEIERTKLLQEFYTLWESIPNNVKDKFCEDNDYAFDVFRTSVKTSSHE